MDSVSDLEAMLRNYETKLKNNQPKIESMNSDIRHYQKRIDELQAIIQIKSRTREIREYMELKAEFDRVKQENKTLDKNLAELKNQIKILAKEKQEQLKQKYMMVSKINYKISEIEKEVNIEKANYEKMLEGRSENKELQKLALDIIQHRRECNQLTSTRNKLKSEISIAYKIILDRYRRLN